MSPKSSRAPGYLCRRYRQKRGECPFVGFHEELGLESDEEDPRELDPHLRLQEAPSRALVRMYQEAYRGPDVMRVPIPRDREQLGPRGATGPGFGKVKGALSFYKDLRGEFDRQLGGALQPIGTDSFNVDSVVRSRSTLADVENLISSSFEEQSQRLSDITQGGSADVVGPTRNPERVGASGGFTLRKGLRDVADGFDLPPWMIPAAAGAAALATGFASSRGRRLRAGRGAPGMQVNMSERFAQMFGQRGQRSLTPAELETAHGLNPRRDRKRRRR